MLSCAAPRNCRSVAEQVWFTAALPFPHREEGPGTPVTKIATAKFPASRSDAGLHPPFVGPCEGEAPITRLGGVEPYGRNAYEASCWAAQRPIQRSNARAEQATHVPERSASDRNPWRFQSPTAS